MSCRTGKIIGLVELEYHRALQIVGVAIAPQPVGAVINGIGIYKSVGKRIVCSRVFVIGAVRGQICLVGDDVFKCRAVEVDLFTEEQAVVFGGVGYTNILCLYSFVKLELDFV